MEIDCQPTTTLPPTNPLYSPTHPLHFKLLAAHAPVPGQEPLPRALLASLKGKVCPAYVDLPPQPQPHQFSQPRQPSSSLGLDWSTVRPQPGYSFGGAQPSQPHPGLGSFEGGDEEPVWTPRPPAGIDLTPPSSYDRWEGRDKVLPQEAEPSLDARAGPSSPANGRKRKATDQGGPADRPRREYACSECGKTFVRPSALEIHGRSHSKEQPFACGACERKFTVASNLRRHQQVFVRDNPRDRFPSMDNFGHFLPGERGIVQDYVPSFNPDDHQSTDHFSLSSSPRPPSQLTYSPYSPDDLHPAPMFTLPPSAGPSLSRPTQPFSTSFNPDSWGTFASPPQPQPLLKLDPLQQVDPLVWAGTGGGGGGGGGGDDASGGLGVAPHTGGKQDRRSAGRTGRPE